MAAPLPIEEEFRGPPTPLTERYFTTYYAVGASARVYIIVRLCLCCLPTCKLNECSVFGPTHGHPMVMRGACVDSYLYPRVYMRTRVYALL